MFVTDDPEPRRWPTRQLQSGELVLASTSEVYGAERMVNAFRQRATFEQVLAESLAEGYLGIRVVADNTSLTAGRERMEAWERWEAVADRFMATNPMTALCGFDLLRVAPDAMDGLLAMHGTRYRR